MDLVAKVPGGGLAPYSRSDALRSEDSTYQESESPQLPLKLIIGSKSLSFATNSAKKRISDDAGYIVRAIRFLENDPSHVEVTLTMGAPADPRPFEFIDWEFGADSVFFHPWPNVLPANLNLDVKVMGK